MQGPMLQPNLHVINTADAQCLDCNDQEEWTEQNEPPDAAQNPDKVRCISVLPTGQLRSHSRCRCAGDGAQLHVAIYG